MFEAMEIRICAHAEQRANAHGLIKYIVDMIWDFGREIALHNGRYALVLDHAGRRAAKKACTRDVWRAIEGKLNSYLVVEGGTLITVCRLLRPIRR